MRRVKIIHKASGTLLADGPLGWGITPFEGNFYIQRRYLQTDALKTNLIPGLCIYKFVYVWLDLVIDNKVVSKNIGWKYILPNPLLPFIWFRVALPGGEPELAYQLYNSQ